MDFGTKLIAGGTLALVLSGGTVIHSIYTISKYEDKFTREYWDVLAQSQNASKNLNDYSIGTPEYTRKLEEVTKFSELEKSLRENPKSEASINKLHEVSHQKGPISFVAFIFGIAAAATISVGKDERKKHRNYSQMIAQ